MDLEEEKNPAQWALDLYELSEFDRSNHFFKYYHVPIFAIGFGAIIPFKNLARGYPIFLNKPYIVLSTVVGIVAALFVKETADYRYARRDQMIKDYVTRFPEDFPQPNITRYGDRFFPWKLTRE